MGAFSRETSDFPAFLPNTSARARHKRTAHPTICERHNRQRKEEEGTSLTVQVTDDGHSARLVFSDAKEWTNKER